MVDKNGDLPQKTGDLLQKEKKRWFISEKWDLTKKTYGI